MFFLVNFGQVRKHSVFSSFWTSTLPSFLRSPDIALMIFKRSPKTLSRDVYCSRPSTAPPRKLFNFEPWRPLGFAASRASLTFLGLKLKSSASADQLYGVYIKANVIRKRIMCGLKFLHFFNSNSWGYLCLKDCSYIFGLGWCQEGMLRI